MSKPTGYLAASRHPWPCFLFVLPLLLLYETSVKVLGGAQQETLLNGAHYWVRLALEKMGLPFFWLPPVLLITVFLIWIYLRRKDRPTDLVGVLSGISIESVAFALGLWAVSRVLAPLMQTMGVQLAVGPEADSSVKQLVPYLGAGIYEEAVFRLLLYSAMYWLMRNIEVVEALACLLAALGSATLFSVAHHVGPYGQEYGNYVFVFRVLAGLYFAFLFHFRGFGVAVGTHACYNVMVSVGTMG
jgi:Type II CAAX prenyl endopeptidase Rce1-like